MDLRIKFKLHYITKYIFISLPVLMLLFALFSDTNYVTVVGDMFDFMTELASYFPSDWYASLLDLIGISYSDLSNISFIITFYPLYVFYVYLFDLILDIICFLPKFLHDLFYNLMDKGKF